MNSAQVSDIPRVDQSLDDDKPLVRHLPEVRATLPTLCLPRLALRHALRNRGILDAALPPQRIKLLCVVHHAAKLEPSADRPVVLDVRTLVNRQREQAVVHGGSPVVRRSRLPAWRAERFSRTFDHRTTSKQNRIRRIAVRLFAHDKMEPSCVGAASCSVASPKARVLKV